MKGTVQARERRRHPVGVDPRRDERRLSAEQRKAEREQRTAQEQLRRLDEAGHEAKRERARLQKEVAG